MALYIKKKIIKNKYNTTEVPFEHVGLGKNLVRLVNTQ